MSTVMIDIKDKKHGGTDRIEHDRFGGWLHECRLGTASEQRGDEYHLSRRELCEIINDDLPEGETPISQAIIMNIELGRNVHQGYWDRVMQICRGLEIEITFKSPTGPRRNYKIRP